MSFRSSQNMTNDYKKNDDNCVELQDITINIESDHSKDSNKDTNNECKPNKIKNDVFFIVYYYKNSELIKEIFKLTQFIILVGIFEYGFFITIVNKYKIANIDTILCNIESKLL